MRKILFLIAVLSVFVPINTAFAASNLYGNTAGEATLGFEAYDITTYVNNASGNVMNGARTAIQAVQRNLPLHNPAHPAPRPVPPVSRHSRLYGGNTSRSPP